MKYNLKNRPNVHEYYYRKKVHDWFEGFQKDLPYKLDALANGLFSWVHQYIGETVIMPSETQIREFIQRWADKEILGE